MENEILIIFVHLNGNRSGAAGVAGDCVQNYSWTEKPQNTHPNKRKHN